MKGTRTDDGERWGMIRRVEGRGGRVEGKVLLARLGFE